MSNGSILPRKTAIVFPVFVTNVLVPPFECVFLVPILVSTSAAVFISI